VVLLEKAEQAFPGHILDKGLIQEEIFYRIPRYVVEYLLARMGGHHEAVEKVRKLLEERYLGPGHEQWIKDQLLRAGRFVLIDRLEVQVDLQTGTYRGRIPSLGEHPLEVRPRLAEEHPGVLYGMWGTLELLYDPATRRVRLGQFIPFEAHLKGLEPFQRGRQAFTEEEWTDFLLGSVGINPEALSERQKLLYLARLAPLVEPNLHYLELGPRQTGKTYLLRNTSAEAFVVSGGKVSPAVLFYNQLTRRPGLIPTYEVVIFDEIAHTAWEDPSVISILKDYMESGQFSRGGKTLAAQASLVFLGNADDPTPPVTRVLPNGLRGDTAFLDRIHGLLPGHEFPKVTPELLYQGPALVVDYLAAALRGLRPLAFSVEVSLPSGYTQRDIRAVRKWLSALLKLLYPHRAWPEGRVKELMDFALELRERVYEELHRLNPGEFPSRKPQAPPPRLEWAGLHALLPAEYTGLFQALQEAGLPPPEEGPEDLTEEGRVIGQSLARWGQKRLVPPGLGAHGLEVHPDTPVVDIRTYLEGGL
jgi:ATP-dependent Lon protease